MRVKFLAQARSDLLALNEYYREIGGAVLALRDNPEIAPPYELAPGFRRLVAAGGAFLVFYRVRCDVDVLHIRRAERESVPESFLAQIK